MTAADSVVIRLVGLASGEPTPYDGQWLVDYDPARSGCDALGRPMLAHVVTTADRDRARRFADAAEAYRVWRLPSGLPYPMNAPLTAYTIAVTRISDPEV